MPRYEQVKAIEDTEICKQLAMGVLKSTSKNKSSSSIRMRIMRQSFFFSSKNNKDKIRNLRKIETINPAMLEKVTNIIENFLK